MKIVSQLSQTDFVIRVESIERYTPNRIAIAHDYVRFEDSQYISTLNNETLNIEGKVRSNILEVPMQVQLPIRMMQKAVMPILLSHKYMQPEHLAPRDSGLDKIPAKATGIMYHPYSLYPQALHYWDSVKKIDMVAVLMKGDAEFNHVTLEFYNKFIKPNL